MKEYYNYSAEMLEGKAKLPVKCMNSSDEVFKTLADEMISVIETNNAAGKPTVIICPVGPVGHYPFFVDEVNNRRISLRNCWFFNMDEYLTDEKEWISSDDRLSFRGFMNRTVYSKIDEELVLPESQRIFPDPKNPHYLTEKLESLGGADLCVGGIGINGHLAFNEPNPELSSTEFGELCTRVLAITPETRTANAIGDLGGAIEDMPKFAVTIGMHEILSSKKVRLGVFRPWHRAVVRRAACCEATSAFPVSLLQNHPDALIFENDVASERPVE